MEPNRPSQKCDLIFFVLLTLMLTQIVSACEVELTIDQYEIDPGDDNRFRVNLAQEAIEDCTGISVHFTVVDPQGVPHEHISYLDSTQTNTGWLSYLDTFTGKPNTVTSGRYYVSASISDRFGSVLGSSDSGDFVVNVAFCNRDYSASTPPEIMAEMPVVIESVPERLPSDIVSCCSMDCCLSLILDRTCGRVDGDFPAAQLHVTNDNPSEDDYTIICSRIVGGQMEYTSVELPRYMVIGRDYQSIDYKNYTIIDTSACLAPIEDINECELKGLTSEISSGALTTKRVLIDEDIYRYYVSGSADGVAYRDPKCRGFYEPADIYDPQVTTPRYLAVYEDITDLLYCHEAPPIIKNSKWCHIINFAWYSVVNLTNPQNVTYITQESIAAENVWNNLSGYIVLGHACPIYINESDPDPVLSATECFDAEAGSWDIEIECKEPYESPCGAETALDLAGKSSCIYHWYSNWEQSLGFSETFCLTSLAYPGENNHITLKVADNLTDIQRPAPNLTKSSRESIKSNITAEWYKDSSCTLVDEQQTFDYGPPYRECSDESDLQYYRLFDEDTMWTKIFAITPKLQDEDEAKKAWDLNWSRTSPPDGSKVTIYIGGGCKRVNAFFFNLSSTVNHAYYDNATVDYVNVTILDGQNPPVTYSAKGRNLLPFPPADGIEDDAGQVLQFNPYDGVRYSYFAIEHEIPEDAAYLQVFVNYTCKATLKRITTCSILADEINDTSTVYDNYTIELLEHENGKDNCKWSSPLMWENISGNWTRVYDSDLQKHIFQLDYNITPPGRRMVSVEPGKTNALLHVLVKGDIGYPYEPQDNAPDSTIGFFADEKADNFWFINLHMDKPTKPDGNLSIGECQTVGGNLVCSKIKSIDFPTSSGEWYNVKLSLRESGVGYSVFAKIWVITDPEPLEWNINYTLNTTKTPPEVPHGNYWAIGTSSGVDNESIWFDPEPDCGLFVTGYYDVTNYLGRNLVTKGHIEITDVPDIVSGFSLSIDDSIRADYGSIAYPAKHVLYRKEKAAASPPYPDIKEYEFNDKYGYQSINFSYMEQCNFPICSSNCFCEEGVIFRPKCISPVVSEGGDRYYYPYDCICYPDSCDFYPFTNDMSPCSSTRTFHENEDKYFDFVDFDAKHIIQSNKSTQKEVSSDGKELSFGAIVKGERRGIYHSVEINRINSHKGVYEIDFSAYNITVDEFRNGELTIYTHFREYTYPGTHFGMRGAGNITYEVLQPSDPKMIPPNTLVEVEVTLRCGTSVLLPNEDVKVLVTNYDRELIGVRWEGEEAFVRTDSSGRAAFKFIMGKDVAEVTLIYEGSEACGGDEDLFFLGGDVVESPLTGIDFLILLVIFFIIIFSYRLFRRGRMDFEDMWQEFRGEKD